MNNPYRRTTLPDTLERLQARYDDARGGAMFADACARLSAHIRAIDPQAGRAVARHLSMGIYPSGACYLALRGHGVPQDEALRFAAGGIRAYARKTGARMARLCGRMPLWLFRRAVRAMIASGYPSGGWTTTWLPAAPGVVAFEMRRCLYWDTFRDMGCPELCAAYCDADPVIFAPLSPRIAFARRGTLAQGCPCCDFTFTRKR